MEKERKIDNILDDLIKSGSEISYLEQLKKDSLNLVKKDESLSDALDKISVEIKEQTEEFLNKRNENDIQLISGISTCIYLPDFANNGEYKLKLIGGNKSRDLDIKINENTVFDVASITKVFTLLLTFKLEEIGLLDLNTKICDVNPDFQGLEDFTFNDLIRLHGEYRTNGAITDAKDQKEAYEIFKTLYLTSNTREQNKYNDFGAMVIGDTIEKIVSNKCGKNMKLDEIMNGCLIKPLNLGNTMFNPKTDNVSGNGNNLGLVHDPKSRILGGALGHAGIFTTSDDLARLAKEIYSVGYVNKEHLSRLGEITFPESSQSQKGNLGIYVKHPAGYDKTFTPPEFSKGSFSHQGWTGALAVFDPNNMIHNNILVNAIYESENKDLVKNDKPKGYMDAFCAYQDNITRNIMLMYVTKKYYNKYCNVKENIDVTKMI